MQLNKLQNKVSVGLEPIAMMSTEQPLTCQSLTPHWRSDMDQQYPQSAGKLYVCVCVWERERVRKFEVAFMELLCQTPLNYPPTSHCWFVLIGTLTLSVCHFSHCSFKVCATGRNCFVSYWMRQSQKSEKVKSDPKMLLPPCEAFVWSPNIKDATLKTLHGGSKLRSDRALPPSPHLSRPR